MTTNTYDLHDLARITYWSARDWGYYGEISEGILCYRGHGHQIVVAPTLAWEDNRGGRGQYPDIEQAGTVLAQWFQSDARMEITEPGMYPMSDARYFADPVPEGSLSQSRAKTLLVEGGPAKFRYEIDAGEVSTDAYDFGKAMHHALTREGTAYVTLNFADRRTNAYKDAAARVRALGLIPLLPPQARQIDDMLEALHRHKLAHEILSGESIPELAAFLRDDETKVWLRGKFDLLTPDFVVDYKTSTDARPVAGFTGSVIKYGYHIQDAMYRRLARELSDGSVDRMLFVVQDKEPPFLPAVVELDDEVRAFGDYQLNEAIRTYAECKRTGDWPGYPEEIVSIGLPSYARNRATAALAAAEIAALEELIERT